MLAPADPQPHDDNVEKAGGDTRDRQKTHNEDDLLGDESPGYAGYVGPGRALPVSALGATAPEAVAKVAKTGAKPTRLWRKAFAEQYAARLPAPIIFVRASATILSVEIQRSLAGHEGSPLRVWRKAATMAKRLSLFAPVPTDEQLPVVAIPEEAQEELAGVTLQLDEYPPPRNKIAPPPGRPH